MDWVPISAAALLTGAIALVIGAQLIPTPDGEGTLLRAAAEQPDQWVALAILLMVASIGLIIGLPSLFVLFQTAGFRTGLVGTFGLAVGGVMLAGVAQVLVIFRSLAANEAVTDDVIDTMAGDTFQQGMLAAGFGAFYVGELLLALALLRAGTTPRWVPFAFVAHVALVLLEVAVLSDWARALGTACMAAGFAGAGIAANRQSSQAPLRR